MDQRSPYYALVLYVLMHHECELGKFKKKKVMEVWWKHAAYKYSQRLQATVLSITHITHILPSLAPSLCCTGAARDPDPFRRAGDPTYTTVLLLVLL
jgi:hypothetical protein